MPDFMKSGYGCVSVASPGHRTLLTLRKSFWYSFM